MAQTIAPLVVDQARISIIMDNSKLVSMTMPPTRSMDNCS